MKTILKINELNLKIFSKKILENIGFEVNESEFILLTGRNGSGKTSLLKTITQLFIPEKESIEYNINRRKIVLISNEITPDNSLRVKNIIDYHVSVFKTQFNDYDFLQFVDIDLNSRFYELSFGQKIVLMFLLSLSQKPELILIDDVISIIDAHVREVLINKLIDYIDEYNASVILVSQTVEQLSRLIQRIIVLDEGKVVLDNNIDEFLNNIGKIIVKKRDESIEKNNNVLSFREVLEGYEYIIFPVNNRIENIKKINLNEALKALIGGYYVKKRN